MFTLPPSISVSALILYLNVQTKDTAAAVNNEFQHRDSKRHKFHDTAANSCNCIKIYIFWIQVNIATRRLSNKAATIVLPRVCASELGAELKTAFISWIPNFLFVDRNYVLTSFDDILSFYYFTFQYLYKKQSEIFRSYIIYKIKN